jgi:hypothetical protein
MLESLTGALGGMRSQPRSHGALGAPDAVDIAWQVHDKSAGFGRPPNVSTGKSPTATSAAGDC